MSMFLEVVASGECDREFFTIETEDTSTDGLVEAVWMQCEGSPSMWEQVDGPAPGSLSQRPFLLGATLRQLGMNLSPNQGDSFDHKSWSGDAWEYYLSDGFMVG